MMWWQWFPTPLTSGKWQNETVLLGTIHTPFSLWIKNYEFEKRVRDMKFMNFFRLRSSLESNDYQVPGVCHTSDDGSCDWPVRGNRGIRRRVVFCVLCIFLETCRVSSNLSNLTTTICFQCFFFVSLWRSILILCIRVGGCRSNNLNYLDQFGYSCHNSGSLDQQKKKWS
jgi:hypothetical protein